MEGSPAIEKVSGLSDIFSKHISFKLFGSTPIPLLKAGASFLASTGLGVGMAGSETPAEGGGESDDILTLLSRTNE